MKIEEAVDLMKSGLQKFHRFDNEGAYMDLSKLISAYPKNGSARYWLGCALFNMYLDNGRQRKHLLESIEHFEEAIKNDYDNEQSRYGLKTSKSFL